MSDIRVAVVAGDGIGVDVTAQAVKVLEAVAASSDRKVRLTELPWGADHYLATYAAIFLPAWTLESVEDDPLRAPVRHLQDVLAAHIERRLAPYADLVVRLDTQATAVDTVVAHILADLSGHRGL